VDETDSILSVNEELGLTGIVVKSLPATLGTATEPERYTVPVLFTRRPNAKEVAAIHGDIARKQLADAGYDGVGLTVDDRRLETWGRTSRS
jgi:hypothetical protein